MNINSNRYPVYTQEIISCLKPHLNQILTVAEVVLAGDQFKAFRRLVLKEFGRDGFEAEIVALIDDLAMEGKDHTPTETGRHKQQRKEVRHG